MSYQKKSYSPQFKFDRVIEAITNGNISEIGRKYSVTPNIISRWKDQLMQQCPKLFQTSPDQEVEALRRKVAKLEQMVGKKEVELSLIKNFSDFYGSQNTS